jgi:hypothetical protein
VVEAPNEWQPSFDGEMGAALSRMLDEQDAVRRRLRPGGASCVSIEPQMAGALLAAALSMV